MVRDAELHTLGNVGLLDLHKVGFLCSRSCPAALHPAIRDWAIRQRESGVCVISGFHSPLENMVLHCLLPGSQPIILALACGIKPVIEPDLAEALAAGRLLKVTRYAPSVTHPCAEKCFQRNRLMLELADEIVVAYASAGGELERLCAGYLGLKPLRGLAPAR
jgi:predicted Rossmann fold nucleotide-binding protein DprA/Smf involved in DNA uptake